MTYSGTGTQATPPHQITAADLIDDARTALGDSGDPPTFSDDTLLTFLNEAIREYSQHLPREGVANLITVAGQRYYALPWDTSYLTGARYGAGGDRLEAMSHKRSGFAGGRYYDFLPRYDLTNPPLLLLSFEPPAGEPVAVDYIHPHDHELSANRYLTVPAEHHHVLVAYVLFTAARQLQAREQAAPTGGSLLMGQLAANARRHEISYLQALNRILSQRQGHSRILSWRGV